MTEVTAYHEAGHTLLAYYLGGEVRQVTLEPERDDGPRRWGDVEIRWHGEVVGGRSLAEKEILVALAGPVAEMIHRGEPLHPAGVGEWAGDWQVAWTLAARLAADPQRRLALLEEITRRVYRLLNDDRHWAALAAIVDALLAHGTLEAEQVEEAVEPWLD